MMKKFILLALVSVLAFTGCVLNDDESKSDDPKIEISAQDKTPIAFTDETTSELNFTAHEAWNIDVGGLARADGVQWIRLYLNGVETYSGPAGEIALEVRVDPNDSGQAREAQIVINSAGEQVAVSVTQSATTQSEEIPENPDPNGYTARLTAHVWHHVLTTRADDPDEENRNSYTMTFAADGTASSTEGEGWSGVPFAVSGDALTLGEGDEAAVYNITTLTEDTLVLADEHGTTTFSKDAPEPEEEPELNVLDEISDAAFKAVAAGLDTDGVLTAQEAASVVSLDVSNKGIASMAGIEYFTGLTELHCNMNNLTSLDVSKCRSLTRLSCAVNQLTSLDVSECVSLTELTCLYNQLTSLDISNSKGLKRLVCAWNQLTSLDVSSNTSLEVLDCHDNRFASLDVSGCMSLAELYCNDNSLTSLDVSVNTSLEVLDCIGDQLTLLDVSSSKRLRRLRCARNQLTSLDVSGCVSLIELSCYDNLLTSFDVSSNASLKDLDCHDNRLSSLDISNNPDLRFLQVYDNPGDGQSTFPITGAWFDNSNIPANLTTLKFWEYDGATITVDYVGGE